MGGFLPVPGQTVYGASKAAVKLLTEGLHSECAGTNVHITAVFPELSQRTSPPTRGSRSRSMTPQRPHRHVNHHAGTRRARHPRRHGEQRLPRTDRPGREADGHPLPPYPTALRTPHRGQNEGPTGTVTRAAMSLAESLEIGPFGQSDSCIRVHGRGRRWPAQTRESAAVVARQSTTVQHCGSPPRRRRVGRGIMANV